MGEQPRRRWPLTLESAPSPHRPSRPSGTSTHRPRGVPSERPPHLGHSEPLAACQLNFGRPAQNGRCEARQRPTRTGNAARGSPSTPRFVDATLPHTSSAAGDIPHRQDGPSWGTRVGPVLPPITKRRRVRRAGGWRRGGHVGVRRLVKSRLGRPPPAENRARVRERCS